MKRPSRGPSLTELDAAVLGRALDARGERLAEDAVPRLRDAPARGASRRARGPGPDALDEVLDRLSRPRPTESEE